VKEREEGKRDLLEGEQKLQHNRAIEHDKTSEMSWLRKQREKRKKRKKENTAKSAMKSTNQRWF
jgi:hypothetical protein